MLKQEESLGGSGFQLNKEKWGLAKGRIWITQVDKSARQWGRTRAQLARAAKNFILCPLVRLKEASDGATKVGKAVA